MDSKEKKNADRYTKDIREIHIQAVCKDIFDLWKGECYELVIGKTYLVSHVRLTTDFCYISLEGLLGTFNALCFSFLDNGKEIDITQDTRCYSEALKNCLRLLDHS